jgi:hypothetical protein
MKHNIKRYTCVGILLSDQLWVPPWKIHPELSSARLAERERTKLNFLPLGITSTTLHKSPSQVPTLAMGWFWGSSESNGGNKSEDPLRDLDPSLREFLKKESPVKYSSSNPAPTSQPPTTPQSKPATLPEHPTPNAASKAAEDTKPKVPAQSLYKDGRYAELWKTYQSQSEVEAEAKSDQEKINDVLEGYKYRKAEIGRAALENCALEQWDVNECFRSGGWHSRITMCRAENKQLERCYMMQAVCPNSDS